MAAYEKIDSSGFMQRAADLVQESEGLQAIWLGFLWSLSDLIMQPAESTKEST